MKPSDKKSSPSCANKWCPPSVVPNRFAWHSPQLVRPSNFRPDRPTKCTFASAPTFSKTPWASAFPAPIWWDSPSPSHSGVLIGNSAYGLEVLRDVTPESVEAGKQYIAGGHIAITLADDIDEKLYVDVVATDAEGREARAIIAGKHTHFVDCEVAAALRRSATEASTTTTGHSPSRNTSARSRTRGLSPRRHSAAHRRRRHRPAT